MATIQVVVSVLQKILHSRIWVGLYPRLSIFLIILVFWCQLITTSSAHAEKSIRYAQNEIQILLSQKSGNFFNFLLKSSGEPSPNFIVYYLASDFPETTFVQRYYVPHSLPASLVDLIIPPKVPNYIISLIDNLEFAYQRILSLGFPVPASATEHLITVLIVPQGLSSKDGCEYAEEFFLSYILPLGEPAYFIVLANNINDPVEQKWKVAHEVFHIFQGQIPDKRLFWLLESTATWAEDEVHAPTSPRIGYPCWVEDFWREFGTMETPFSGLTGYSERNDANNTMWYGSSILFKWWTEHLTSGETIVPELFAPGLTPGNAKDRLINVIEEYSQEDFPLQFLRAGIATQLLNGPEPYRLSRGHEPVLENLANRPEEIDPQSLCPDILHFDVSIEPWAAYYRTITAASQCEPDKPKPLFIFIDPGDSGQTRNESDVRVALIETSLRFGKDKRKRVTVDELQLDGWDRFVVPHFADDSDETVKIDLVAVNGSPSMLRNLEWKFAVGAPPLLENVRIIVGAETVYDAVWMQGEIPDKVMRQDLYRIAACRKLNVIKNKLSEDIESDGKLKDVRVELGFSKPVGIFNARLGQTELRPNEPGTLRKSIEISVPEITFDTSPESGGEIKLSVEALDEAHMELDGNPKTAAALTPEGDGWLDYESGDDGVNDGTGGADTNHKLRVSPEDEPTEWNITNLDHDNLYPMMMRIKIEMEFFAKKSFRVIYALEEHVEYQGFPQKLKTVDVQHEYEIFLELLNDILGEAAGYQNDHDSDQLNLADYHFNMYQTGFKFYQALWNIRLFEAGVLLWNHVVSPHGKEFTKMKNELDDAIADLDEGRNNGEISVADSMEQREVLFARFKEKEEDLVKRYIKSYNRYLANAPTGRKESRPELKPLAESSVFYIEGEILKRQKIFIDLSKQDNFSVDKRKILASKYNTILSISKDSIGGFYAIGYLSLHSYLSEVTTPDYRSRYDE
jgi:hypothetical protein